jgi:hypothetical protein
LDALPLISWSAANVVSASSGTLAREIGVGSGLVAD